MSKRGSKKAKFIALLPQIYELMISEGYDNHEIAIWLKEKHSLDFFSKKDPKSYSSLTNYLTKFGLPLEVIRKAQQEREENRIKELESVVNTLVRAPRGAGLERRNGKTTENIVEQATVKAEETSQVAKDSEKLDNRPVAVSSDTSQVNESEMQNPQSSKEQETPFNSYASRLGLNDKPKREIPKDPLLGYKATL